MDTLQSKANEAEDNDQSLLERVAELERRTRAQEAILREVYASTPGSEEKALIEALLRRIDAVEADVARLADNQTSNGWPVTTQAFGLGAESMAGHRN